MNHRVITLQPLTAALGAGVLDIDLDMIDPITQIVIELRVLSGVAASMTDHPLKVITKIEIVDGSDVLFSLNGIEAQTLDIYNTGIHPRGGEYFACNNMDIHQTIALNFGRYLWDEILALDPSKFANPKLRITYNYALGGLAPASCQFRIYGLLFDEKVISPTGFLMAKEIKSWACTDLAHEYTDLPTDHPYRMMLIGSRYNAEAPNTITTNIKLSSDQDKKVIFDASYGMLLKTIARENAYVRESMILASAAAARYAYCCPTMETHGSSTPNDGAATATHTDIANCAGGYLTHYSAVAGNVQVHVEGYAPHGFLGIPFGKQEDIDDWFDVRGLGSLKLDVTSGSTTPTVLLVLQQNRSY